MATQKLSAKRSALMADGDIFHNGTTGFDEGDQTAVTSDGGDDLESAFEVCLEWDSSATVETVLLATQRITDLIVAYGLPADKDA